MARSITSDERAAIASAHSVHALKLELENPDGSYQDMGSFEGYDWVKSATLSEHIDGNAMQFSAELIREQAGTALSLAPFREDSELNVDGSTAYAPFLDIARRWKLSVSVQEYGVAHSFKPLGEGLVTNVAFGDDTIRVTGLSLDASLLTAWIVGPNEYSAGGADDLEDVIQDIMDDMLPTSTPTLLVPTPSSFVMNPVTFQGINAMEAIQKCARLKGWVARCRYDSSDVFQFTLYEPNRSAGPGDEDWTLGPEEYTAVPTHEIDGDNIRNNIVVKYWDDTADEVTTHTETVAASVTRYGGPHGVARTMEVDLSSETNITTAARAEDFAEAVASDLSEPAVMEELVVPGFWPVQLGDFFKLSPNGVHSDVDRYAAATSIRHHFADGRLMTTIGVRGKPAGKYRVWIRTSHASLGLRSFMQMRIDHVSETSTQIVVRVRVIVTAENVSALIEYDAGGLTVSPGSGQIVTVTNDFSTTGTMDFTITRPPMFADPVRVSFTAFAAGAIEATDGVDVAPQITKIGRCTGNLTTTPVALATVTIPANTCAMLTVRAVGRSQTDGSLLDHIIYNRPCSNVAGTITFGTATTIAAPALTEYLYALSASGNDVTLTVAHLTSDDDVDFIGSIEVLGIEEP